MSKPSYIPFGKRAIVAGGILNDKYKHNGLRVINSSGSAIAADKLVAIIGYNTTNLLPKIVLADANTAQHCEVYVTLASIADGSEGFVFKGGLSTANLNTNSASAAGDPVYLSTAAGGFAHTAPAQNDAVVLPVGWVVTKSATVGKIHWHVGEREKLGYNEKQIGVTSITGASATLDAVTHAERTVALNRSGGVTVTLPAATGTGNRYRVVVGTASNANRIEAAGSDVFVGGIYIGDSGDSAAALGDFHNVVATDNLIAPTTAGGGGLVGDWIDLEDAVTGKWIVYGVFQAVADPATPFATT